MNPSGFGRVEAPGGPATSWAVGVGGGWRVGFLERWFEAVGDDMGRISKEIALCFEVGPGEVGSSKGGKPVSVSGIQRADHCWWKEVGCRVRSHNLAKGGCLVLLGQDSRPVGHHHQGECVAM